MFTGIIESVGKVSAVALHNGMMRMTIQSDISPDLHVDQSVCHDGVCLTVVEVSRDTHVVELVGETLARSRFRDVQTGELVNLERSLRMSALLDGHIVQGHVDTTAECLDISGEYYSFSYPSEYAALVVEKGSICLNGVSLTIAGLTDHALRVALIPYTLDHTNLRLLKPGSLVNVEFDILGKYVQKHIAHHLGNPE